ncbi:MAG: helicase-related protein, partial [Candidatus Woesearchaeota archaeon]
MPRKDSVSVLACDTIAQGRQALVFVNAKRSAQKVALDIAKHCTHQHVTLAQRIQNVLSQPTDQCRALAQCVQKGIAFHHAGLAPEQKQLIEDHFRKGDIHIIVCTPTLAVGVDLPAYRVIIRDLKRFSGSWGMQYIPVLEYQQMAGRAGRPGKETLGQAICVASSAKEVQTIEEKFIYGQVEPIYSKLAVEPVLRTYVLSLLAMGVVQDKQSLLRFFAQTFWAQQYQDMDKLSFIIDKVVQLLQSYHFLDDTLHVTPLGHRVSELYLDPLTAHHIIEGTKNIDTFSIQSIIQLLCNTLEIRPLPTIKKHEQEKYLSAEYPILGQEPSWYDFEYESFLQSLKLTACIHDWLEEYDEEHIMSTYDIRPGELHAKLNIVDWLLYCASQLCQTHKKEWYDVRIRSKYGVKEELLPLLRFKGIGRKRARI